jgi:K+-transporting ATPase KdpF subunit
MGNRMILQGDEHGHFLSWVDLVVFRLERRARLRPGKAEETAMSWLYLLSGALALGIIVYLIVALLFPEKF